MNDDLRHARNLLGTGVSTRCVVALIKALVRDVERRPDAPHLAANIDVVVRVVSALARLVT